MDELQKICKLLRYWLIRMTTEAGSGHLTSCLSAVELMAAFFVKHYQYDLNDPGFGNNDRLIFSKGHAAPLFYALYALTGKVTENELLTLRKYESPLEGHPTKRFKYTDVPTGSLGQGLSIGAGMAIQAKADNNSFLTTVLLGDGEIAEGSVWEACEISSYYKLNNLLAVVDVNRLGQSQQTLFGHDLKKIESRFSAFGFRTYVVNDGHNLEDVMRAYDFVITELPKGETPYVIIAKTIKGKGVSFLEDENGWHGKALSEEDSKKALEELGEVDKTTKVQVNKPESANTKSKFLISKQISNPNTPNSKRIKNPTSHIPSTKYSIGESIATREAYGNALVKLCDIYDDVIILDADMKNSTHAEKVLDKHPDMYLEMFIAEQNMVGVALGLSQRGMVPYVSTFAAFFTRAYDQIRMANYSGNHIVFCGSHYGVSIGADGPSQMGLEDVAMFRVLPNTKVFAPSDAVSCEKLVELMYKQDGINYMRFTKIKQQVIYKTNEKFKAGGSKVLKRSAKDAVAIIATGVTVNESLEAYKLLKEEGVDIRVIDAYCIKPIDEKEVAKAANETKAIITVEDHYIAGGLGDAVLETLASSRKVPVYKLGVIKAPMSGTKEELLDHEGISAKTIVKTVKDILRSRSD